VEHGKKRNDLAIEKGRFQELTDQFPLRSLRTRMAHKKAMAAADRLAVRDEESLSVDERDYLETLSLLIENYESTHDTVDLSALAPADILKHLMEEHAMTTTALGKLIGSKGIGPEILTGKRNLSKVRMMILAKHFSVEPAVFLPAIS
jgi:antitoxin component HigA of HigAB toxin-antitoxin module